MSCNKFEHNRTINDNLTFWGGNHSPSELNWKVWMPRLDFQATKIVKVWSNTGNISVSNAPTYLFNSSDLELLELSKSSNTPTYLFNSSLLELFELKLNKSCMGNIETIIRGVISDFTWGGQLPPVPSDLKMSRYQLSYTSKNISCNENASSPSTPTPPFPLLKRV